MGEESKSLTNYVMDFVLSMNNNIYSKDFASYFTTIKTPGKVPFPFEAAQK